MENPPRTALVAAEHKGRAAFTREFSHRPRHPAVLHGAVDKTPADGEAARAHLHAAIKPDSGDARGVRPWLPIGDDLGVIDVERVGFLERGICRKCARDQQTGDRVGSKRFD